MMNHYTISKVSKETGIHMTTLRRWEELGLISPERISLGHSNTIRVYDQDELDLLRKVKELMGSGIRLRTAFAWAIGNYEEE
jgi:DNA-binding transcriptional MerR regulator